MIEIRRTLINDLFLCVARHSVLARNIVLNERFDRFTMGGKDSAFHMSGVFFIKDGKIAEWNDYGMPKG